MFTVFDTDVIFNTSETKYKKYNGSSVEITDVLTEKECDIYDVNVMFKIQFEDETTSDAYCDEIEIQALVHPEEYIDEHTDYEFAQFETENAAGGLIRFLMGVDDDGEYYLTVEDDNSANDYYAEDHETLEDVFYRLLTEIIVGNPMF